MYQTPAVRSIIDDPVDGATVQLLVEVADDEGSDLVETVATAIEAADGTVEDRRRFGTLLVSVDQSDVAAVCSVDGIEVVETTNAATIDPDGAGEDVDYDG